MKNKNRGIHSKECHEETMRIHDTIMKLAKKYIESGKFKTEKANTEQGKAQRFLIFKRALALTSLKNSVSIKSVTVVFEGSNEE